MIHRVSSLFTATALVAPLLVVQACGDSSDNEDTTSDDGEGSTDSGPEGDADADADADAGDTGVEGCASKSDSSAFEFVSNDITSDTTWTCDTVYVLDQDAKVFVTGATLTIEPGTTVLGTNGSALVVEKDAMLVAEGTADAPIVMTSALEDPARGDWGGLVLLGQATANIGTGQAEGFPTAPTYGGNDDTHNCGSLAYLRVEWAGFAISDGNELNGITFYACGSETSMHHVQVHMGLDDGIEWFGGGFDADHLVVSGAADDSFDIDQGFRGTLQYVVVHQDPTVGDNGFEISNQGTDFSATPKNAPTICNATVVGSGATGDKSKGFTFKEGTEGAFHSTIFTHATNQAGLFTNAETQAVAEAGAISIRNSVFFGNGAPEFVADTDGWTDAELADWILQTDNANLQEDPALQSMTWGAPDFTPGMGVSGAGAVPSGCEANDYIGAVDPAGENWTTQPWVDFGG